ncbi:uncharacterized protein LOC111636573 [Centruroides sculpturatus]|uniref:uncharacterized protein LOC111636573 n=1 Tax=Centruroides sculpturatus TaxID=218467 RepID=UPI000C6D1BA0|nr:uncharacterized protein LOC111636573 [Centruroides sculpturatus]
MAEAPKHSEKKDSKEWFSNTSIKTEKADCEAPVNSPPESIPKVPQTIKKEEKTYDDVSECLDSQWIKQQPDESFEFKNNHLHSLDEFSCDKCAIKYVHKDTKQFHKCYREEWMTIYVCKQCRMEFTTRINASIHEKFHRNKEQA